MNVQYGSGRARAAGPNPGSSSTYVLNGRIVRETRLADGGLRYDDLGADPGGMPDYTPATVLAESQPADGSLFAQDMVLLPDGRIVSREQARPGLGLGFLAEPISGTPVPLWAGIVAAFVAAKWLKVIR